MSSKDKSNDGRKYRSKRRCKRRYWGHKLPSSTEKSTQSLGEESQDVPESSSFQILETAVASQSTPAASERKITSSNFFSESLPAKEELDGFRLIHVSIMKSMLDTCCVCSSCKIGKLILGEDLKRKQGLSSLLILDCGFCGQQTELQTSPKCSGSNSLEINKRSVLSMIEIGGGRTSLAKICACLNLPPPLAKESYNSTLKAMKDVLEHQANASMEKAAKEEHIEKGLSSESVIECKAMFDGTWRKRGHSSLQGAVTAISVETGKCLDIETLNKICASCTFWDSQPDDEKKETWKANHTCQVNYTGSAPAMEQEGVKRIFTRSAETRKLQYTGYVGDGDSKSFSSVKALKPYGEKVIKKFECVGHVQKRMGSALRKLKTSRGRAKLCDGKTIGGRGRLTAERIDKLQVYYGLAIRRNKYNVEGMKKEIWAGLHHSASTDEKPQHDDCPQGDNTWCKFLKAQKSNQQFTHKNSLPDAIVNEVKPIYERLTKDELLEGCLGGFTQNNCESLNHLIWARCPKSISSGRDSLDCAAAGAVLVFNEGNSAISGVLRKSGIEPGYHTMSALRKTDKKRIRESNIQASVQHKRDRKSKRKAGKAREECSIEAEGITYEAGAF